MSRLRMNVLLTGEEATEENIVRMASIIGCVEDASVYVCLRGEKNATNRSLSK